MEGLLSTGPTPSIFSESSQGNLRSRSIFFVLNQIFHGVSLKSYRQNQNSESTFYKKKRPNQPCQPLHMGGQDIENVLSDPHAKVRHTVA